MNSFNYIGLKNGYIYSSLQTGQALQNYTYFISVDIDINLLLDSQTVDVYKVKSSFEEQNSFVNFDSMKKRIVFAFSFYQTNMIALFDRDQDSIDSYYLIPYKITGIILEIKNVIINIDSDSPYVLFTKMNNEIISS